MKELKKLTDWFEIIVRVLQGSILWLTLLVTFLEVLLTKSLNELDIEAVINGYEVNDLRFADDIATVAGNDKDLQVTMSG